MKFTMVNPLKLLLIVNVFVYLAEVKVVKKAQYKNVLLVRDEVKLQSQGPCEDCRGKGEVINEKDKCKTCQGKKVNKEKKIIDAEIDKGAPNGQTYVFHGEGDEFPGVEAGDVIIIVQEQPHKVFKRKGADILMEKEITLL